MMRFEKLVGAGSGMCGHRPELMKFEEIRGNNRIREAGLVQPREGAATAPEPEEVMQRTVVLSPDERAQLEQITKSDPKPYRRERAAALLKIAAGAVAGPVARAGLRGGRPPENAHRSVDPL